MRIEIRTFGLLKDIIKDAYFEVEKDSTMEDLLLKMAEKYGGAFTVQVYNPHKKRINDHVGITLNGQFLKNEDILTTRLRAGDRVAIFVALAGG
jgi:molybdopterin converting factor small subunit